MDTEYESAHKVDPGQENPPAAPARIRTHDLSIRHPALLSLPTSYSGSPVDYAAVQAQCRYLSGNELTCNVSVNVRPRSPQLAEPLWADPSIKN